MVKENKENVFNKENIFNKNLDLAIENTAEYFYYTDMKPEEASTRMLLSTLINSETSDMVKDDLKLAKQKIREAHLILIDLKQLLAMFD